MAVSPRVIAAALLVAGLFGAAIAARGADLQWAPYGTLPGNPVAFSVASDPAAPGTAYAATLGFGLLRTTDGKTWTQLGAGILPSRLWRVAIDAANGPGGGPPPIYVGSAGQGFFKSLDDGKTWQQLNTGLGSAGSRNVRAVGLGRQLIVLGTSDGVYKSTDGGKTWQSIGLGGLDISAVAFAQYSQPTVIIAGIDGTQSPGSRVVRTVDMGANWIPLTQGIPSDLVVSAVAAGPVPSNANLRPLFVAGSGGVFKSDDGGQSWSQLSGLPAQGFNVLQLSAYDPNIVYAASDGGGSGNGGVWRSTDRGSTWSALQGGLAEKGITALTLGRNSPATLIALAWNPDKPLAPAYFLSDTQAAPGGQPEGGVCPEPGTQDQCVSPAAGAPSAIPSAFAQVQACATPSSSPSPSPSTSPSAADTESPSPSTSPTASPSSSPSASASVYNLCPTPSPGSNPGGHGNSSVLVWIGAGTLGILAVLLAARIFLLRR